MRKLSLRIVIGSVVKLQTKHRKSSKRTLDSLQKKTVIYFRALR